MTYYGPELKWQAEMLGAQDKAAFDALLAKLRTCTPDDFEQLAREIFELGHDHGYELCSELSRED